LEDLGEKIVKKYFCKTILCKIPLQDKIPKITFYIESHSVTGIYAVGLKKLKVQNSRSEIQDPELANLKVKL
jgi:hypothetical protein